MPANRDFIMSVLVGGVPLPEYEKDGLFYVESNLFTPVSYNVQTSELVLGEVETQSWPVTPYQVKVTAKPRTPYSYYKVYVDGQKATQIAVHPGKSCVSEGFYDGVNITEFLFSLPRFAQNKKDRMDKSKASRVGFIEVECWNSRVTGYKKPSLNGLEYNQANKKDSSAVTNGEYTMATTMPGRAVRTTSKSTVEDWTLYSVRSQLSVKYAMGQSLTELGFKLIPIRIPIHRIPASVLSSSGNKRLRPGPKSSKPKLPVRTSTITSADIIEIDSGDENDLLAGVSSAKRPKLDGTSNIEAVVELDIAESAVMEAIEEVLGGKKDGASTANGKGEEKKEDKSDANSGSASKDESVDVGDEMKKEVDETSVEEQEEPKLGEKSETTETTEGGKGEEQMDTGEESRSELKENSEMIDGKEGSETETSKNGDAKKGKGESECDSRKENPEGNENEERTQDTTENTIPQEQNTSVSNATEVNNTEVPDQENIDMQIKEEVDDTGQDEASESVLDHVERRLGDDVEQDGVGNNDGEDQNIAGRGKKDVSDLNTDKESCALTAEEDSVLKMHDNNLVNTDQDNDETNSGEHNSQDNNAKENESAVTTAQVNDTGSAADNDTGSAADNDTGSAADNDTGSAAGIDGEAEVKEEVCSDVVNVDFSALADEPAEVDLDCSATEKLSADIDKTCADTQMEQSEQTLETNGVHDSHTAF